MKKQLRLSTAAVLAMSAVVTAVPANTAEAATYKDVSSDANFYKALQELSKQGIINGYADGTFKPNAKITRGQLAKILTRLLNLKATQSIQFSDVSQEHDFYRYASAVVEAGYMTKQNGKFNASQTITRNEYAQVLQKAFNLKGDDVKLPFKYVNSTYKAAIQAVYANGIMTGVSKTNFNGTGDVKRSQLVLTLHRAMQQKQQNTEQPDEDDVETLTITAVSPTSFKTDDDSIYVTPTSLQKLFVDDNAAMLSNAEIEVEMKNNKIIAVKKLTLMPNQSKTRTLNGFGGKYSFPIVIQKDNTILKNMQLPSVITGDEATGGVTLQNVVAQEGLTVEDGYARDFNVQLLQSKVGKVEVKRNRVTLASTSKLPSVFVSDDAYNLTLNAAVQQLQFERDSYFTLYGTGAIDVLNVYHDSYLYLRNTGTVKKLVIANDDALVSLDSSSRVQHAVIPAHTSYNDVFSYPSALKYYVSKVSYPNSNNNILANEIVKPSKEEIAFQRAVENVLKDHVHTVSEKSLTLRTSFNEILPTMKEVRFEQRLFLVGNNSNGRSIAYTVYKGATQVGSGNLNIASFKQGVTLEDLIGVEKSLKSFTTNSSVSYTVRFDTERELQVRSTVYVNGVAKNSDESVINPGNEQRIELAKRAAVKTYSSTLSTGDTISTNLEMNTIPEILKEIDVSHFIKVHTGLEGLTQVPLTIRRNNQIVYSGNVSVQQLKSGFDTSKYLTVPAESFATFADNSTTNYTYQFGTTQRLDASVSLYLDGNPFMTGNVLKLNESSTTDPSVPQPPVNIPLTYKVEATSDDSVKFTFNKLETIPEADKNKKLDVKLKMSEEKLNTTTVKLEVTIAGKGSKTIDVPVSDLKNGISVLQRANFTNGLTVKDLESAKAVTIKVLTPLQAKFEASALIEQQAAGTTTSPNKHTIEVNESLLTDFDAGTTTYITTDDTVTGFSAQTTANGLRITTDFGAKPATMTGNLDALLTVTNGINTNNPNEKRYVSVYFNGTLIKSFAEVTNRELNSGVLLSDVLGSNPQPINTHVNRKDIWDIVVHNGTSPIDFTVALMNGNTKLAEAQNTVNKQAALALRSAITFAKDNSDYVLTSNITSAANIQNHWPVSFIVQSTATTATNDTVQIKAVRTENGSATTADTLQLTMTELQQGFDVNALKYGGQPKPPLTVGTVNGSWRFTINPALTVSVKAIVKVNHYVVKETTLTP